MATEETERSPFTRPGFIISTIVIALILVLGVVIGIVNITRQDPEAAPTTSASSAPTSAAPTTEAPQAPEGDSVCGLPGVVTGDARLTKPPAADEWQYHGTAAYPTSAEFGPAATADEGYRYCYQHSPEGAVFASAYASIAGADPAIGVQWFKYFAAPGPYREQFTQKATTTSSGESPDMRMRIAGYRLLSYDGDSATVDIAIVVSIKGQTVTMSAVYPLVWVEGDWKLSTETPDPGGVASIPDLTGYTPWGE
ncbi:MAG: hypothetical protein Q4G21_09665 [Dermabacter sp.]|nr:hypothetical protein [Dermabacter sp.]